MNEPSVHVTVKLFAAARQTVGSDAVDVVLNAPADIRQLRTELARQFPELAELASHSLFAVGTDYGQDDTQLADGFVVAWIPPVSGG